MESINLKYVFSAIALIFAAWQMHDRAYAKDMKDINARLNVSDRNILALVKEDRRELILQELRNNKAEIARLRTVLENYIERKR